MDKQHCVLCGYPDSEYINLQVPLAHPAKTNTVCFDCIDDILAELHDRGIALQQHVVGEVQVVRPLGS